MKSFIVKTLVNAAALGVAVWLFKDDITLSGDTGEKVLTLVLVALIFGVVNAIVKPLVKLFSLPLVVLTLGLFTLVINALMLLLTSWLADVVGLEFDVDGFWTAVGAALVVSIVSWALSLVLDRD
ncbi:phage holin family protein [Streptomyces sp. NPDC051940]|uniref:phage holin family protein n=1 Tax=Streptomyces sp. NPDC051940 TaxID=3155675 RepID=UPI00341582A0